LDQPHELRELARWYRGWADLEKDGDRAWQKGFADYLEERAAEIEKRLAAAERKRMPH
jgi:hypothetical protein